MTAVIATATFYRDPDDIRAALALETMKSARVYGYPVIVVDGGSPDFVVRAFANTGAQVFSQNEGMGKDRRKALKEAAGRAGPGGCVVWLEPEKHPLVAELHKVVRVLQAGDADLIIPRRESLDSYPREQALAEMFGNLAVSYMLRRNLDHWFGPFAANHKALQHFLDYEGDYGDLWDSIHIPRLRVVAAGLRIADVLVHYEHPLSQTQQETGKHSFIVKRLAQLQNLIPSFHQEAAKLGLL